MSEELLTPKQAMEQGLIEMLEESLNERLRPNVKPLLAYARTPRLAFDMLVEYNLVPAYGNGVISVSGETAKHDIKCAFVYRSPEGKSKAMCLAVASVVLGILTYRDKEKHDG